MSTCPDNELFSAYIDGEIPPVWAKTIGNHIQSCEKCSCFLKRLTRIQQDLKKNADEIIFSPEKMDDSFDKLQLHLRFHNNIVPTKKVLSETFLFRALPATLAAILLCTFFLPLHFLRSSKPTIYSQRSSNFSDQHAPSKAELIKKIGVIGGDKDILTQVSDNSNRKSLTANKLQHDFPDTMSITFVPVNVFAPDFDPIQSNLAIKLPKITDIPMDCEEVQFFIGFYK